MPSPDADDAPPTHDPEPLLATMAQLAAARGDALAVAVLAEGDAAVTCTDQRHDWGEVWYAYTLRLVLAPDLYARLDQDRGALVKRLEDLASEVSRAHDEHHVVGTVVVAPTLAAVDGWRASALGWLRGEGITNQGRVRSDNIAARSHDGLLFRSPPEIHLYAALKARGVYFAPLPVFVRGGATYQRLEPDFVVLHRGVAMVVEVDGDTVHHETPAQAHARTEGLARAGARIERVTAAECATPAAAERCAAKLLDALERYRELRT